MKEETIRETAYPPDLLMALNGHGLFGMSET